MKAHPISISCQCEVCEEGTKSMIAVPTKSLASPTVEQVQGMLSNPQRNGLAAGDPVVVKRELRVEDFMPEKSPGFDPINHPAHYNSHPSGVECITITQHYNFCLGNVIKYLWRSDLKNSPIEDLKKARWYLDREISNREASLKT